MTTTVLVRLLVAVLVQDPAEPAVTLAREVRKHHAMVLDSEVRLRLAEITRKMSDRASLRLFGELEDPEHPVLRSYDLRTLIAPLKDSHSHDFWSWTRPGDTYEGPNEEAREPLLGDDLATAIIESSTGGADRWQGETTLDRRGNGIIWVSAPPDLQRKVARVLQDLNREALTGIRISVTLLASGKPLDSGAPVDGTIPEADWARLLRQVEEGGLRRIGSLEIVGQADQVVSGFSGARRSVAMTVGEAGPIPTLLPDGLALEASAVGSGERVSLRLRLAFTKVLGIDELPTSKGTLRLPRVAEVGFSDQRTLAAGVPVYLGTMGPFPAEADVPPHVSVVVRVSWVRP